MAEPKKFEDFIEAIDKEIIKRKPKWNLKSLSWLDFDDVSQIIRIHIYKKWHLYDQTKPIGPWLNAIIANQIKNLIRNNYANVSKPCHRCAAYGGENLCLIYEKQSNACPLYAKWEITKQPAYNLKTASSLEFHSNVISSTELQDSMNLESNIEKLHGSMESILKPLEWKIYKLLYIENKSEDEVAKIMNYTTSETNRTPGYKHIKNIKKSIIEKAKRAIAKNKIDIY